MLKIKDVKYGIIPTGQALGMKGLQIFFKDSKEEYIPDEYDTGKRFQVNKETRIIEEVRRELFASFLEKIKEKGFEKHLEMATNKSMGVFLVFMGGEIDKPENFKEYNRFTIDLGHYSWNVQAELGAKPQEMKPPFCMFVGTPLYLSGKNQFYELFNSCYPVIKLKEPYNTLAVQECLNGVFTPATIFMQDGDTLHDVLEFVTKFKVMIHKVWTISKKPLEEPNYYRFSPLMTGKDYLKF